MKWTRADQDVHGRCIITLSASYTWRTCENLVAIFKTCFSRNYIKDAFENFPFYQMSPAANDSSISMTFF